jgi:hypothetical protein
MRAINYNSKNEPIAWEHGKAKMLSQKVKNIQYYFIDLGNGNCTVEFKFKKAKDILTNGLKHSLEVL